MPAIHHDRNSTSCQESLMAFKAASRWIKILWKMWADNNSPVALQRASIPSGLYRGVWPSPSSFSTLPKRCRKEKGEGKERISLNKIETSEWTTSLVNPNGTTSSRTVLAIRNDGTVEVDRYRGRHTKSPPRLPGHSTAVCCVRASLPVGFNYAERAAPTVRLIAFKPAL